MKEAVKGAKSQAMRDRLACRSNSTRRKGHERELYIVPWPSPSLSPLLSPFCLSLCILSHDYFFPVSSSSSRVPRSLMERKSPSLVSSFPFHSSLSVSRMSSSSSSSSLGPTSVCNSFPSNKSSLPRRRRRDNPPPYVTRHTTPSRRPDPNPKLKKWRRRRNYEPCYVWMGRAFPAGAGEGPENESCYYYYASLLLIL